MRRARGWRRRSALVAAIMVVAGSTSVVRANADTWKTASSGLWETGSNWTDGTTPGNSDTAMFNVFGSFTTTFGVSPAAIQNLSVLQGTVVMTSSGGAKTLNVTAAAGGQDLNVSGASTGLFVGTSGNAMHLNIGDDLSVTGGATMQAAYGSHITASDLSASGLNGTLRIDGAGTTLALTGAAVNYIGTSGGTGSLVFQNNSSGSTIASDVYIASAATVGTGTVTVSGNSTVTLSGGLYVANGNVAGSTGTVNVSGTTSALTQNGYNSVIVGSATNGSGTINISVAATGGTLTTGSAGLGIFPTGTINVGNGANTGTLVATNYAYITGGGTGTGLNVATGSTFTLSAGGAMYVQSSGKATFGGSYSTANNASYYITDPGSKLSSTGGTVQVVNGGVMNVWAGGAVSGVSLNVGSDGTNGTLIVDGAGSSAVATSGTSVWGLSGGTANVTFRNSATGTFTQGISLAPSSFASVGNLNVQSGAQLTSGTMTLAVAPSSPNFTPSATVTVTDAGSSVTLTPGSSLTLGDVYGDPATLTVQNNGTFTVGSGGSTTIYSGSVVNINGGVVDLKSLTYNGGTFNFSAGSLSFIGNMTVGVNGMLGTDLTLTSSRVLTLTGTTTVDPFRSLSIAGGTLNTGSLAVNGTLGFYSGTLGITGASGLTIGTGGPLGASFSLGAGRNLNVTNTATVASSGILYLNGGAMTATGGITNNGEIQILDPTSQLGGGTITNNKLIDGNGRINNNLSNAAGGEVRASGAQRLTFAGTTNTNAGKINMVNGGTVEFTGALTNSASGVITGRGALMTSSLSNSGQVQISAGLTDVYGPVTTNSGGKVIVSGGGTATFYNAVTMNAGSEFRVSAGSTAVFFGPVTGVGLFTGTGAKFFEAGASEPGMLVTGGSTFVDAPASLAVDYFREASLTVSGTASTNAGAAPSVLGTLVIDAGATLDMADNKLILDYTGASPVDTVRQYLLSARLISSVANADGQHRLAIGYAEASQLGVATWGGVGVDGTAVVTKLTYFGDANLDGKVNADDFALIDRGLAKHLAGWTAGDFNYDNVINAADYLLIDRVYVQQGGVMSPELLAMREAAFGAGYVSELLASVPEPGLGAVGLVAAVVVGGRRRR